MCNLGKMYSSGTGCVKNHAKAFEYQKMAADKGFEFAFFEVGSAYLNGKGVEKSMINAIKYFKMDTNNIKSLYNIGSIYFKGLLGNEDYKNAFKYWKMAADKGHSVAMRNIASLYKNGIGCEKNEVEFIRYAMMHMSNKDDDIEKSLKETDPNGKDDYRFENGQVIPRQDDMD